MSLLVLGRCLASMLFITSQNGLGLLKPGLPWAFLVPVVCFVPNFGILELKFSSPQPEAYFPNDLSHGTSLGGNVQTSCNCIPKNPFVCPKKGTTPKHSKILFGWDWNQLLQVTG